MINKLRIVLVAILSLFIVQSYAYQRKFTKCDENMNKEKIYIYQVLPRIFGNTNSMRQKDASLQINGVGKFNDFTNTALNEIKNMGFNYIWYTGVIEHATQTDYTKYKIKKDNTEVVKGKAGSPYAIKDYYDVSPDLAVNVNNRMQEYEQLVQRTHEAGLNVIMDFVPNHVARQYHSDAKPKGVKDLGEGDNTDVKFDTNNNFYYLPGQSLDISSFVPNQKYKEMPAKVTGNNSFSNTPNVNDWYETIKLNYGVDYTDGKADKHFENIPDTWTKMRDILLFWASKNIDGFRCDMAEMVPVEFWGWVIPTVKEKYPNLIFIAEIYNPNEYYNYVHNGKFDYLYDKVDLYDTLVDVIKETRPTSDITFAWQHVNSVNSHLLYFLENHDEVRIASKSFADNPWKAMPALQLICWMNVNPVMIYFGQELGEKSMEDMGFSGPDGRTTIFDYWSLDKITRWNNGGKYNTEKLTAEEKALREKYIGTIRLSELEPCLDKGCFYDLMYANYNNHQFNSTKQYVFLRNYGNEFLLIVNNFSSESVEIEVEVPAEAYEFMNIEPSKIKSAINLLNGEDIPFPSLGQRVKMKVGGYDSAIYKYSAD